MAPDLMIDCVGLTKRYGDFHALRDCDLKVRRGEVFGLLGPNGAGKTTLIRSLLGFLKPTAGTCHVDGIDAMAASVEVRRRVAYLPGDARLPRHMRGTGVLKFFAEMHPDGNLDRSLAVADRFELNLRTRVAFMSTGMRQKLALAVVLGPSTPLLILDEPTANLDPTVRGAVLQCVREAQAEGRTVVLSSHVLSEIEETCGRVAFLRRGILAHQLSMNELFQQHRITGDVPNATARRLIESPPDHVPHALSDRVRLSVQGDHETETTLCIDTSGDLAPMLPWLDSLEMTRLRIEPLGLRAVYDAVHFGHPIPVGRDLRTIHESIGKDTEAVS